MPLRITTPFITVALFMDQTQFSPIRTLNKIAMWNPGEIIIPNTSGVSETDSNKLYEDIDARFSVGNCKVTKIHRRYYSEERGLQQIKHLCAPEYWGVELQIRHQHYGLSAAYCLLKYIEFVECVTFAPKSIKVEFQASTDCMMIDVDTAKHVELLASSLNAKTKNSLFGILNKCCTANGSKNLRAALFQPSIKESLIEARLDAVTELVARPEILSALQTTLTRICNLDGLLSLCAVLPKTGSIPIIEQRD